MHVHCLILCLLVIQCLSFRHIAHKPKRSSLFDVSEDAEFERMKAEMEALMATDLSTFGGEVESSRSSTDSNREAASDFGSNVQLRKAIAIGSTLFGCALFFLQPAQSVSGVALLHAMDKDSISINVRNFPV